MKYAVAVAMLLRCVLSAQDIASDWQGMLKLGKTELRVVINIAKTAEGGWTATEFYPEEGSNGVVASSVIFDGSTLKLAFESIADGLQKIRTSDVRRSRHPDRDCDRFGTE